MIRMVDLFGVMNIMNIKNEKKDPLGLEPRFD